MGSDPVNVTTPIQPTYSGLAGSTLIIPPQTTATITMHTQQQNYWITLYAAPTTPGTDSTDPGSIPASVYVQQQGNPALQPSQTPAPTNTASTQPTPTATNSTSSGGNTLLAILVVIVVVGIAMESLIFVARTKRKQARQSVTNRT